MKISVTFLLVFLTLALWAQQPKPQFEHITVESGLPDSRVQQFIQDKDGYIWMGTRSGLVRYNGYETKTYQLNNKRSQYLISLSILTLFEDTRHTLWVGTYQDGLYRYDRRTDTFQPSGFQAAPENNESIIAIEEIIEAGNGALWLYVHNHSSGKRSAVLFEPRTRKRRLFGDDQKGANYLPTLDDYNFFTDQRGGLWLGVNKNNTIYHYDPKAARFVAYPTGIDSARQSRDFGFFLYQPRAKNELWFSRVNSRGVSEIVRFNTVDKTSAPYTFPKPPAKGRMPTDVFRFFEDKKGRLWLITNEGLFYLDRQKGIIYPHPLKDRAGNPCGLVFRIAEDKTGTLWISTTNALATFDLGSKQITTMVDLQKETDPSQVYYFQDALLDRSGNLWLSDDKGIHRLKQEQLLFTNYRQDPTDPGRFPIKMLTGLGPVNDSIWLVAANNDLYYWNIHQNTVEKTTFPKDKFPGIDYIVTASLDKKGIMWGAYRDQFGLKWGLFRFYPRTKKINFYKHNPADTTSVSSESIKFFFADKDNTVWLGTWNKGLCRYDPVHDHFIRYPYAVFGSATRDKSAQGKLYDESTQTIYEDRQGVLWIGTSRGGLNRFNPQSGTFTAHFDPKKGLRQIQAIYEDTKGRFWLGSGQYGLHRFDRQTGTSKLYTEKDGLLSNGVLSIVEDRSGKLWISTTRGLCRFDPERNTFRAFTKQQGAPENQLTEMSHRLSDGRILISTSFGFFTFDPAKLTLDTTRPQTLIESVSFLTSPSLTHEQQVVTVPTFGRQAMQLAHDENKLTFTYCGIHYKNAELNRYAYRLEGYDKQWIQAGGQRSAVYTNLSTGTYTFKVKSSNADGIWNEKAATFTFTIRPPWWLTWWAYLLYALLAGALLRAYTAYRSRALRQQNRVLEENVALRTHQVRQQKEEIEAQRDHLEETLTELKSTQEQLIQKEKMASLGELTAGIAHEIQNPLNFVNNFAESSIELSDELKEELDRQPLDVDYIKGIVDDLSQNQQKIFHHGGRADSIVRGMLEHSRMTPGERQATDLNKLADEYLRLSYHGLRAKESGFNAKMVTYFADDLGEINLVPQEIGRVLLNLYNNAFYATQERQTKVDGDYMPTVEVSTHRSNGQIVIKVKDNGTGMPESIQQKIFQPFFTTKPTGQGTGLGLSLSYDIITKGHGGTLVVESTAGVGSTFTIHLPEANKS